MGGQSLARREAGLAITTSETFGRHRVWPRRLAGDSQPCLVMSESPPVHLAGQKAKATAAMMHRKAAM